MFIALEGVLTATEAGAIRQAAETLGFGPGSETAGRHARQVKANDQARPSPELEAIQAKVRAALAAHPVFASAGPQRHIPRITSITHGLEGLRALHPPPRRALFVHLVRGGFVHRTR